MVQACAQPCPGAAEGAFRDDLVEPVASDRDSIARSPSAEPVERAVRVISEPY
jgi:hypothetical protein